MNHLKIPTITIVIFMILYIVATFFYPGGSHNYPDTVGFDIIENYWCDLLAVKAKNGLPNDAFPIAMTAMIILCLGLGYFFYLFPKYFPSSPLWDKITQFCGIGAMIFAILIFTDLHDQVILIGSSFGLFALIGMFAGLYKSNNRWLLAYGIFCMMLVIFNNVYYFAGYSYGLPLIQKISFVIILFWVVLLNNEYRELSQT